MKKSTKVWLFLAAVFCVAGFILIGYTFILIKGDFHKLNSVPHITNQYEITEEFYNITINVSTVDVQILPSPDSACTVVCHEKETLVHDVFVKDGALLITENDILTWTDYIEGINFDDTYITIYLPESWYQNITISISTGDVQMNDFAFDNLNIEVSTGDIKLENVIVHEGLFIDGGTGDVDFTSCDANRMDITLSTGDVNGTLLTPKIFQVTTSTGTINIPEDSSDGICKIRTSTGDITIQIQE